MSRYLFPVSSKLAVTRLSAWCMRMNEFDEGLQKERFIHKFCLEYNERDA